MAKNTNNNRIAVKWVRDRAKKAYEKTTECFICGTSQDLELHHLHSITILLNSWAKRKNYDITTDEGILEVRDEFIEEHNVELYDLVYTLCNKHHVNLHQIFGKAPSPHSIDKQGVWIDKQKAKLVAGYVEPKLLLSGITSFAAFY